MNRQQRRHPVTKPTAIAPNRVLVALLSRAPLAKLQPWAEVVDSKLVTHSVRIEI